MKKITAFGCTSRGQAHRAGLWLLQTEKLETKTVTFTVGAEGLMHIPGDVIKVADTDYAGTNIGGRVLAIDEKVVTLDRDIDSQHFTANSYFTYLNEQASHQDIRIVAINGNRLTLERVPTGLSTYGVWSLTTQTVNAQLFRALSVKEETKGKYTIVALQHEPQKEAIVDRGAKFESKPTSVLPSVGEIMLDIGEDGKVRVDATVTGGQGTVRYDLRLYKDGILLDVKLSQKSPALSLDELGNGDYLLVIQAKNERGQLLNEQTKTFTIDRPPVPRDVRVVGGLGDITLSWAWVNDATQTEIFAADTDDIRQAKRVAKVNAMFFTHQVGAKQVRYYWLRHTRGQNLGPFYQQSGLRGESAVDIDAELKLLNEKLSQNIINDVIDTALPARNLEMIKTVKGLNTQVFLGANQVHNTLDGKLYVWNGREYTAKVAAADIDGQLSLAHMPTIPTTQLSGKVSANQLDSALMNQLNGAQNTANAAQTAANSAQSAANTAKSQAEQENTKLATLSTNVGNVSAQITAEQTARAAGDKANADKITALTTQVGNAQASVETVSRTVVELNGKLTATHTIKTQAIAGNHTAIAGLSLGASKEESSVIVMADKFQVVKNAQDGSPKNMLSVVNNQVAINGDLVANGSVTADKLAANSVTSATITTGVIRGNHIAAGELTADKLAIGLGGNLLYNPIFANPTNGVPYGWSISERNLSNDKRGERQCIQDPDWGLKKDGYLPNENVLRWSNLNTDNANTRCGIYQTVPITEGKWYIISAYMGNHRNRNVEIYIDVRGQNGEYLLHKAASCTPGKSFGGLNTADRVFIKFKAPARSVKVDILFFMYDWVGNISDRSTYMFVARPMLEECTEHTREPSPWQNAGVTSIHGGSIATRTITTQQLAAGAVTANEIAANTITGNKIAARTLSGNHIATKSLTANEIAVNSLSAISANLGNITGGSLNINNRFKVSTQGQVEMRAAAGNVGLVINNNQIIVYDEQGRVRVKMGQL